MINWKYEEPKKPPRPAPRTARIINGHPNTDGDTQLISDLPPDKQLIVLTWVKSSILPIKSVNHEISSYGIKHLLRDETGIYVTNNQFKDAMLICGFQPVNAKELNWEYRISKRSPVFLRENERSEMRDVNTKRTSRKRPLVYMEV